MKGKLINEIIWFTILVGFYTYICFLIATGRITYFIHPRMIKYIEISLLGLVILAINELIKILHNRGKGRVKRGYILFLIPLVLGFAVAPRGLNTSIADKKGISNQSLSGTGTGTGTGESSHLSVNYLQKDKLTFNDDEYVNMLNDVSEKSEKYNDKRVSIDGFVYIDKTLKNNSFVVARFLMICCAADIQVIGLEGTINSARSIVKSGEWVNAQGVLKYTPSYDKVDKRMIMIPQIKIDKITKIEKPEDEYVYP